MKITQKPIRTVISAAVIGVMTSQAVTAGGFSLYTEGSPAAIGNFAAGIAAEGADASIGWYNPAGLVLMKEREVVFGGVGVFPSVSLSGESTFSADLNGAPLPQYIQSFKNLQGGENALVPSLHYALPLSSDIVFGLSLVAPFGLSTNYDLTSPIRYAATLSKLETVNVAPEMGWKLNDNVAYGIGLDVQYARVTFNQILGSPSLMEYIDQPPTIIDSESYNYGDSFGVGFHTGLMMMFHENHTRFGINYQSQMRHQFRGYSQLTGRLADPTLDFSGVIVIDETDPNAMLRSNNLYSNSVALPAIVTLSAYQDINTKWTFLGSVVYSAWSSFKTITLNNIAASVPNFVDGSFSASKLNVTIPENYRDAWRFAIGANYHVKDNWMLRMGAGFDQTPTVGIYRDVRLPDADRWAVSIGAHYQYRPNIFVDVGYTYLFANGDTTINNTIPLNEIAANYNVNALGKNHASLFGLQVVWKFDQKNKMKQ